MEANHNDRAPSFHTSGICLRKSDEYSYGLYFFVVVVVHGHGGVPLARFHQTLPRQVLLHVRCLVDPSRNSAIYTKQYPTPFAIGEATVLSDPSAWSICIIKVPLL